MNKQQRLIALAALAFAAGPNSLSGQDLDAGESAGTSHVTGGEFRGVMGHGAGGHFTITDEGGRTVIRLANDFLSDRVPDGYVVLANRPDALDSAAVYVAKLESATGAQEYLVPPGVAAREYRYVLVWCKRFSVGIGAGEIRRRS